MKIETMTRRSLLQGFLSATVVGASPAACDYRLRPPSADDWSQAPATSAAPAHSAASARPASLAEKISQLLVVGFRGMTLDARDPVLTDLQRHRVGGVILYDYDVALGSQVRNVHSPDQIRELVTALKSSVGSKLIVAIDQEGGAVARLGAEHGFAATESARQLGRSGVDATRRAAAGIADTLASVGINLNLAPVVDVDVNPDSPAVGRMGRSYSTDPSVVASHAAAFVEAHRMVGVLCALKHFPGHGSAEDDSHVGAVDVSGTWSDLELEPYRKLFSQGFDQLVMTGHIYNATLDPVAPATMSEPIIEGVLRQQLGFKGVVMSDDLQMDAIRARYTHEEAVARALRAGVDLLLIGNNMVHEPDIVPRTIGTIERAVHDGAVSAAQIDQSWQRVEALKSLLH